MNKTELIDAVATRSNTTKAQTTAMLNGLIEVIQANMANGDNVQLVDLVLFQCQIVPIGKGAIQQRVNP